MTAPIGRAALSVVFALCGGPVQAADEQAGLGAAPAAGDYRQEVSKEAAELQAEGVTGPVAEAEPETGPPVDAPATGRIGRIRSLVDEALAAPAPAGQPAPVAAAETPPADIDPGDARRRKLRELVVRPPDLVRTEESAYLGELREEVSATIVFGDAEPDVAGSTGPAPAPAAPDSERYRVRHGDSLWKIAREQLGDGYQWTRIYEANRDTLGDVDVLRVGQLLKLPDR
jgi:nucleoid-associated protein YgaU